MFLVLGNNVPKAPVFFMVNFLVVIILSVIWPLTLFFITISTVYVKLKGGK